MSPEQRASELKRRADAASAAERRAADEQKQKEAQDKAWGLQNAAISDCQYEFKRTANDPDSVQWIREEEDFRYTKKDAMAATVTLGVRAKNGYGGLVHGTIRCTLSRKGDGWELLTAKQLQ